jgi:hypothetical protein
MRLGLFDRIRRLARSLWSPRHTAPADPGAQGRHRRGRRGPAAPLPGTSTPPGNPTWAGELNSGSGPGPVRARPPAPGERASPLGPAGELTHTAASMPDASPVSEVPFAPGTSPPPRDRAGSWPGYRTTAASGARGTRERPLVVPGVRAGEARAQIREAPPQDAVGAGETVRPAPAGPDPRVRRHEEAESGPGQAAALDWPDRSAELARVASGIPRQPGGSGRSSQRPGGAASRPWLPFAPAHPRERPRTADGRRNCGSLEGIVWRQWDPEALPPREAVAAVDRLAELPEPIKQKLAAGLDAIFIGPGGVPDLDDMTGLRGVPLPGGRASWDACAGAYGERKIVVGSRPSPTPDVTCHEIGHALDDLDSPPGTWQSDSAEFRLLYEQCQPHFASDFHRQPGGLGRKEFFADAFAAVASSQRPALVDMLSGNTRTALRVMLYFNRRYGI